MQHQNLYTHEKIGQILLILDCPISPLFKHIKSHKAKDVKCELPLKNKTLPHSNFVFRQNGQNSFKNVRTRAV
jgi:hypothetical protein